VKAAVVSGKQRIQDTGFPWESRVDNLLGYQWPFFGALLGKGSKCD
jgi:hypothetical protein